MTDLVTEANNKNSTIINETKRILEQSYEEYQKKNELYYINVLKFLNLLFNENAESILKIRLKKITLNEEIFDMYNHIIKKFKINKALFDTKNFEIEDIHDFSEIIEIAKIMCNNLLCRLNYKIDLVNYGTSKKFKITIIKNGF